MGVEEMKTKATTKDLSAPFKPFGLLIQLDFPFFLNHSNRTFLYSLLPASPASEVVLAISSVIISEQSQTASLNSHPSLIATAVNGLTDS